MLTRATLARLEAFADLTDDELDWLLSNGRELLLEKGDYFIHEGEPADRFYVTIEGEMQITRTIKGKQTVMGTTPAGIMGGEISILNAIPSNVTSYAIAPSRLFVLDLQAFRGMFMGCPHFGARVLRTASERMQLYASMIKQHEKMAALGRLAAGLAHELNNPAAAAQRAVRTLRSSLPTQRQRSLYLCELGLEEEQLNKLGHFVDAVVSRQDSLTPLSTLERSDREEELGSWLDERNVAEAWDLAGVFVNAGLTLDDLEDLVAPLPQESQPEAIAWVGSTLSIDGLLSEIELSSHRISELVGAVKAYTYMDQGPLQAVDLNRDLDNTLTVLNHKLKKGVQVSREYDPDLPKIQGRGGELTQVWTNLIANAIEAMNYKGNLRVITRCENNFAMVEVADNGPGIAGDVLPHIFEPFFTTKGVGEGTGLGLDISYRVIKQHNGTIEVQSLPGNTRFIVRLPIK
jgi:signal transduction histidine kinase